MDTFLEAREIVTAYLGVHPLKKIIFRTLLAKPKLVNLAMRIGAPCQGVLFRATGNAQATTRAPLLDAIIGNRHIRKLAPKPLHVTQGELNTVPGASNLRVAFFPGCLGDKLYTGMAEACLKVLRHHGVGIYMPSGFACCGIPAIASGDIDGMLAETKVNLEVLARGTFDYIVTPCSSCTSTIKEMWPHYANRLDSRQKRLAEEFAAKAMDINAFLIDVLKVEPLEARGERPVSVTYHDSCHLKKSLNVSAQPRAVIGLNPRYELVEMAEADRCCGCGGSFNLFHDCT